MLCHLKYILIILCFRNALLQKLSTKICGIDNSPIEMVYEGFSTVETYPWLGRLYYPVDNEKLTTTVVLITKELVIGPAFDIDKYPKNDFRVKSKVVLGANCSGPLIGVRDYTYHPDYKEPTYSAIAIIQLDIINLKIELHPICTPPSVIRTPEFYAMTLARDCNKSSMRIFKMTYVDPKECKMFYRKSGLDLDNMWPTHTACAKALSGGECVWRNGAVLVLRENLKWKLMGIGVYGPGCETPSRFLDYGMYHEWVRSNIMRIGRPAVTRLGPDHLILRRTTSSLQRFGPCDPEETKSEIYTDTTTLFPGNVFHERRTRLNLTLFANVDYSCIVLRVSTMHGNLTDRPRISLRRWCTSPLAICYEFQYLQIDFYIEIDFRAIVKYQVLAYGREVRLIERKAFMAYLNRKKEFPALERYWWYDNIYNAIASYGIQSNTNPAPDY